MPRGDKSSYTSKQKRMAEHVEEGYEKRGVGGRESARRAWATVNKETGGGRKQTPARKKASTRKTTSSRTAGSRTTGSTGTRGRKATTRRSTSRTRTTSRKK